MYENNETNEFNKMFKDVGKAGAKGIIWGLIRSAMAVGAYVAIMALRHAALNAVLGGFLIVVLFLLMILWIIQALAGFVGGGMCIWSNHWWKKNMSTNDEYEVHEDNEVDNNDGWVILD